MTSLADELLTAASCKEQEDIEIENRSNNYRSLHHIAGVHNTWENDPNMANTTELTTPSRPSNAFCSPFSHRSLGQENCYTDPNEADMDMTCDVTLAAMSAVMDNGPLTLPTEELPQGK